VTIRAWLTRFWSRLAVGLTVLVVFAVGLGLWLSGDSSSKSAALGTALLSSLVVGVALFVVQAAFSRSADRRQTQAALAGSNGPLPPDDDPLATMAQQPTPGGSRPRAAAPPPAPAAFEPARVREDAPPPLAPPAPPPFAPPAPGSAVRSEQQHHYRVQYLGTIRDTSRLDAVQVRLRVFRGDDYFQFVTVPVPAPELRGSIGADAKVTPGQLWNAIATESRPQLEDAVRRREIPLDPPTTAFELLVDVGNAVRKARRGEVADIGVNETAFEFDL
jgi:hypothetical protein